MIRTRQELEALEKIQLAPYAVKSAQSRGRVFAESEAPDRTCFQRDRNRIIYSKAFLRLKGKTQVVLAGHGDHFRTRITHTHYVATVSRDIARSLGLNEDLAEAISLAHDLGHPCFGHEGQDALDEMLRPFGSHFEHNEQSLRIVETLEVKSQLYRGLNLSYEVLDGIDKHRTVYDRPASRDHVQPSLEAQVVNIGDEIAYKYHDLDDALRAGVIDEADLKSLALWQAADHALSKDEPHLSWLRRSKLMALMVHDLVAHTAEKLAVQGITTVDQIYTLHEPLVGFSPAMQGMLRELGDFLHTRFYKSAPVREYNERGRAIVRFLFSALYQNPALIPQEYQASLKDESLHVMVKDYLAGMTDAYAIKLYEDLQSR